MDRRPTPEDSRTRLHYRHVPRCPSCGSPLRLRLSQEVTWDADGTQVWERAEHTVRCPEGHSLTAAQAAAAEARILARVTDYVPSAPLSAAE